MQKLFVFVTLFFFLSVQSASAHIEGLTPFLKINNVYPEMHPIQKETIIPTAFVIPEDVSKETFLVGQNISFVIDTAILTKIYSEDVLKTVMYEWEMGDGSVAKGTSVAHAYTKQGSKLITIYAVFPPDAGLDRQAIEHVQIDILPNTQYKLPDPLITVNKKALLGDAVEVDTSSPLLFDVTMKNQPSAAIASYVWDFGEGGSGTEKKMVYAYQSAPAIVAPILKVTDANGFVVYTHGLIANEKHGEGFTLPSNTVGMVILGVQLLLLVVGASYFAYVVLRHKKRK